MKNNHLTILAFSAIFVLTVSSCQKENTTATSFTATMEQCQEQDGKTAFTNGSMQWVSGDQIKVFGTASGTYQAATRGGNTTFNLVSGDAGNGPYRAVYPASAANNDGTVELPVVQVTTDGSLTGFPMYTEGSSTNLDFKNLCGILRLRLQKNGVSVSAIEVTGDIELTGDFSVAYNNGNPTLNYSSHGTKTTMLTCSTPQSISSQKDFYLFLPDHTYTGMRIRIYSSDGGVCTKTLNTTQSISIQRSKITTITLTNTNSLTFTPEAGTLPGLFSIDGEGHQVRFAQGNLQYTTLGNHTVNTGGIQSGTWCFAPHQYEYVGSSNLLASADYTKWIDLFRWIASGWNSGHTCNMPYSYGSDADDFSYNYTGDLTGTHANGDCGVFNAISNGGNTPNLWRTLTESEASYLIDTRTASTVNGVENARWFRATIGATAGIVLLPDIYTHPASITLPNGINNIETEYNINLYNLEEWKLMEIAGAVFLPFGGFIDGDNYYYGEALSTNEISYMTASSHLTGPEIRATTIKFHAHEPHWADWEYDYYGGIIGWCGKMRRQNIRLVRDAN